MMAMATKKTLARRTFDFDEDARIEALLTTSAQGKLVGEAEENNIRAFLDAIDALPDAEREFYVERHRVETEARLARSFGGLDGINYRVMAKKFTPQMHAHSQASDLIKSLGAAQKRLEAGGLTRDESLRLTRRIQRAMRAWHYEEAHDTAKRDALYEAVEAAHGASVAPPVLKRQIVFGALSKVDMVSAQAIEPALIDAAVAIWGRGPGEKGGSKWIPLAKLARAYGVAMSADTLERKHREWKIGRKRG